MYFRTNSSGGRTYLLLVEGYRYKETGKVRQRTVINFGRVCGEDDKIIKALKKRFGSDADIELEIKKALDYGDVFILFGIWQQLNLDKALLGCLKSKVNYAEQTVALIRLMVFHRICDPDSKLSCLKWLERAYAPDIPDRIALLLGRIMCTRLWKYGSIQSPADTIRNLKCLKRIEVSVNGERRTELTKCSEQQLSLFETLEVFKPTLPSKV